MSQKLVAVGVFSLFLAGFSTPVLAVGAGDRIKLACPAAAPADHPCRAVYFWGIDGKRHPFPNEDVYFSWYGNFTGVATLSASALASITLGDPVKFRPGSSLVKFETETRTYAVDTDSVLRWVSTEDAARSVYGEHWSDFVHVLPDTFASSYRYGAPVLSNADFNAEQRLAEAPTIDAALGASYAYRPVVTVRGTFDAHVITLDRSRFRMQTSAASGTDCWDGCATSTLSEHAKKVGASIGIHGAYFCPPDYSDCAGKVNSFLSPMFDSVTGTMRMAGSISFHNGPIIASDKNGNLSFYRSATTFGGPAYFASTHPAALDAAMANYPALAENSVAVVESEPRLEDGMKTSKATRGAIGFSTDKIYLVIAKNATVIDLADVMLAVGATNAMNLDGGGSSALLYGGAYKVGPGRVLPNAILFVGNNNSLALH